MKAALVHILLLALAVQGCAANRYDGGWRDSDPIASGSGAREECVVQARASGHRVTGVRSVERRGRDQLLVLLAVEGGRMQILSCDYDERSGRVTLLEWRDRDQRAASGYRRDQADPREECVAQARASGHRVTGVRSVERQGRDRVAVLLWVDGGKQPILTCDYDERSGTVTLLRW